MSPKRCGKIDLIWSEIVLPKVQVSIFTHKAANAHRTLFFPLIFELKNRHRHWLKLKHERRESIRVLVVFLSIKQRNQKIIRNSKLISYGSHPPIIESQKLKVTRRQLLDARRHHRPLLSRAIALVPMAELRFLLRLEAGEATHIAKDSNLLNDDRKRWDFSSRSLDHCSISTRSPHQMFRWQIQSDVIRRKEELTMGRRGMKW